MQLEQPRPLTCMQAMLPACAMLEVPLMQVVIIRFQSVRTDAPSCVCVVVCVCVCACVHVCVRLCVYVRVCGVCVH